MKVGIFLSNFTPEIGGGFTFETEVFRAIAEFGGGSGHNFIVYSWDKRISQAPPLGQHVEYRSLHHLVRNLLLSQPLKIAGEIFKRLRQQKNLLKVGNILKDVILVSILGDEIDLVWYLEPSTRTIDIPYMTTIWDLQHRVQPCFPELSAQGQWDEREQFYAKVLRCASIIVTGTEAGRAEVERFYQVPANRIKILPFPTPEWALNAPQSNGSDNGDRYILEKYNIPENYLFYPAQFWPHKNHVALLMAVKWLRSQYGIELPVVFVGSNKGNYQYIKQVVADLDLSAQVHFLGFVPQADMVPLYRHAFALVFLSFCGPDNIPPLEAFALGCPVVAANVSGAPEQLGDAALLVDQRDEQQVALAIKSLYDDPTLRQTLIERGLARAAKWTGQDYVKAAFEAIDEFESLRRCWRSAKPYYR
jgi:glycosyltransferase involved in cell wall biosynthesis